MYARFVTIAAFAAVAAAAPGALESRTGSPQCNTGTIQCCNSTQTSTPTTLNYLSGLLGLVLPTVDGLIGLGCTPITIGTGSGATCTAQTVCCTDNSFNGLINLGCSPINVGL